MTTQEMAGYIDHTALKAEVTPADIERLCEEARRFAFATVCVNPCYVRMAADLLAGSTVKVCTVAGFPLGASASVVKAFEATRAIHDGATEVDMVIAVGLLKAGKDEEVQRDIRAVVEACREGRAHCKVIIEAALLSDDEKVRACKASIRAGADYVKTSTGFGPGGATAADVELMAKTVSSAGLKVKAAGGIRSAADAMNMIRAGASRIGASASVKIMEEFANNPNLQR